MKRLNIHFLLLVIALIVPFATYSQRISWDTVLCEGLKGFETNGKWGFKDSTGMVIIKPRFDAVLWFSEGLCPVKIKDKWGIGGTHHHDYLHTVLFNFIDARYISQKIAETENI